MSELGCAQMADVVDELALDVLPGEMRALAFDHLEECATCRGRLEELSESADQLLLAYPPVDPPNGFEDRVLDRLGWNVNPMPEAGVPAEPTQLARPRRRSRLLALAAAAAVLAGVAGGAGVLYGGAGHSSRPVVGPSGHPLRTVALISSGGQPIGDVSAYPSSPAWFFLRVEHGSGNEVYQCVLDLERGGTVPIGRMVLADGQGGWGQRVNVDVGEVRSARLVDADGSTAATAIFH